MKEMKLDLPPILTAEIAKKILDGKKEISLDLGLTKHEVKFIDNYVQLSIDESLKLMDLEKISLKDKAVFFVKNGGVYQVAIAGNHFYKLLPTGGAPTLEIDGIRMHRTKYTNPERDSAEKIKLLKITGGFILDTCTGLGYTAIEASNAGADKVFTIEIDPIVHRIALMNPWSKKMYVDKKISCILGNSYHIINAFNHKFFSTIIHDPPRHRHAGHLFSLRFYQKLFNVLESDGMLFHYTGEPRSKYRGVNIQKGVNERLSRVGFIHIAYHEHVTGFTARKP